MWNIELDIKIKEVKNDHTDSRGYDGRRNSLLSGLEKIVQSIAEMRNVNSDAYGAGCKRITVKRCRAILVMNIVIAFRKYIL